MTFKMNFNSTVIRRQSFFFIIIKNVLVPQTSHVKGLHVRTALKLLPVPDNRTKVFAHPALTL